jgi:hypothetical protein
MITSGYELPDPLLSRITGYQETASQRCIRPEQIAGSEKFGSEIHIKIMNQTDGMIISEDKIRNQMT